MEERLYRKSNAELDDAARHDLLYRIYAQSTCSLQLLGAGFSCCREKVRSSHRHSAELDGTIQPHKGHTRGDPSAIATYYVGRPSSTQKKMPFGEYPRKLHYHTARPDQVSK